MGWQYSRRELYELVWSEPRTALGRRLGISDTGLAKACARAGIPMPPRGYWTRLAAGRSVLKAPLPQRTFGQSDLVRIGNAAGPLRWEGDITTIPSEPLFEEPPESVRARAEAVMLRCRIPKGLQNPHQLIGALLDEDLARRKVLEADRFTLYRPRFGSQPALRRLRVVNALFIAMAHAGCQASVSSEDLDRIGFHVGDTFLSVEIEFARRTGHAGRGSRAALDETITLKAAGWTRISGVRCVWSESELGSLENHILEIACDLLVMGELVYRAAARERYKWHLERVQKLDADARAAREQIEREEKERRLRREAERLERLLKHAANRRLADEIRALVDATDAKCRTLSDAGGNETYATWRTWALAQADLLDPCLGPFAALVGPPIHKDPNGAGGDSA